MTFISTTLYRNLSSIYPDVNKSTRKILEPKESICVQVSPVINFILQQRHMARSTNNGLVATPVALLVSKYINSYFNSVCIRVLVLLIEPKIQNIQVLFFPLLQFTWLVVLHLQTEKNIF